MHSFRYKTLGPRERSRNSLHAVRNHRISLLNKVKPAERSGPRHKSRPVIAAPSRSFSFPQLFTATPNSPGHSDRNVLIERAIRLLLISQVCSDGRLGSKMVPVLPWVPTLLRPLPMNSTPSSCPDTFRRPGDFPWQASC